MDRGGRLVGEGSMSDRKHEAWAARGGLPTRLGEILSPALERLGPRGLVVESRLRKVWTKAVGDNVAANATVARLRGKTLELDVASDAWATELTYLAPSIRDRLNELMGDRIVEEVVVRRRRKRR